MRMEMKRNLHGALQSTHHVIGIKRSQQSGHIFDANRVGSEIFEFLGQIYKPINAMDRTDGVADRGFRVFATGLHFAHGPVKVPDVIQRIKDTEDIDTVSC